MVNKFGFRPFPFRSAKKSQIESMPNPPSLAQKTNHGLTGSFREFDGEAAGSRDAGDDGNACGKCLLHDLKREPAAHQNNGGFQGELIGEQSLTNHFVEGIVPADVLAEDLEFTFHVKNRAGMESAGLLKIFLGLSQD